MIYLTIASGIVAPLIKDKDHIWSGKYTLRRGCCLIEEINRRRSTVAVYLKCQIFFNISWPSIKNISRTEINGLRDHIAINFNYVSKFGIIWVILLDDSRTQIGQWALGKIWDCFGGASTSWLVPSSNIGIFNWAVKVVRNDWKIINFIICTFVYNLFFINSHKFTFWCEWILWRCAIYATVDIRYFICVAPCRSYKVSRRRGSTSYDKYSIAWCKLDAWSSYNV